MKGDTGLTCLALALLLAGMSAAGEGEPMKDPQQHNHQAWQASPYGRSWRAEAERRDGAGTRPTSVSTQRRYDMECPKCRSRHIRLVAVITPPSTLERDAGEHAWVEGYSCVMCGYWADVETAPGRGEG